MDIGPTARARQQHQLLRPQLLLRPSTTVVTKWQGAGSLVFGRGRTGLGIGAVFANQTKAVEAPDDASCATTTAQADAGFPVLAGPA